MKLSSIYHVLMSINCGRSRIKKNIYITESMLKSQLAKRKGWVSAHPLKWLATIIPLLESKAQLGKARGLTKFFFALCHFCKRTQRSMQPTVLQRIWWTWRVHLFLCRSDSWVQWSRRLWSGWDHKIWGSGSESLLDICHIHHPYNLPG